MHYYQFNIADYRKDTIHLTPIEHYIYRTLIDWYYLDEQPIPKITHSVIRRLGLVSENEQSVINVLQDFFYECDEGWRHRRIDQEIIEYHGKCETNKTNGKLGGRPKKTHSVIFGNPNESEPKANETLTNNHKPLTNNQYKSSAIHSERDLAPPEEKNSAASPIPAEAEFAIELRRMGVNVQSHNPTLLAWIADGITIQKLTEAAAIARLKKPLPELIPANFLDRIVREPPRQQSPPTRYQTAAGRRAEEFDMAAAEFLGREKPTGTDLKVIEGGTL